MKSDSANIGQAIVVIEEVERQVNNQANRVREELHVAFEQIRAAANEREAELLREIEAMRNETQRDLVTQKSQLKTTQAEMRRFHEFGEILVKEGSESEITTGHKEVNARLAYLEREAEGVGMTPRRNPTFRFAGKGELELELQAIKDRIKGFSAVTCREVSAERSSVEDKPTQQYSTVNHPVTFKVVVVDNHGSGLTLASLSQGFPFVKATHTRNGIQQQIPQSQVLLSSFFSFFFLFILCEKNVRVG